MFSSDDHSPRPAGSSEDHVEAVYAAFETAWQRGDHPALEEFLPQGEPARGNAIKLLAPMDFEYRFALNSDVRIEEYLQRFPQLTEDQEFLGEFISWEAELRRSAKHVIDVDEYVRRFPQVPESELQVRLLAMSADAPPPHVETRPRAGQAALPPLDEEAEMPAQIGRYRMVRRLGQGGFGCVYLAHDEQLNRAVAIKAPLRRLDRDPSAIDRFLKEAQLVAGLDHHAIVPVYDFGTFEEQRYFVVSKYIGGSNLSEKLKIHRLPFQQSAALIATVADALQYAHELKICHRDVKPANILLDENGRVFLTDFGLALTVDGLGSQDRMAGTPVYMSPEQAAGEAHRVDGRSDIFSLGTVLYELLCGEPHTVGKSIKEILYKIQFLDTRPPRQLNRQIPGELERICLRALARRPADRYTAAGDMSDDLRAFLRSDGASPVTVPSSERGPDAEPSRRIVPKGLRSFDEKDHEFFLQLLPGPRDRDGLPNKIRFWKDRIEEQDACLTFCVGLLYGPSGCGKSSFVKAGLLPLLSNEVVALYVEATADDTETRLKKVLDRRFAEMSGMATLKERLAAVRRRQVPLGAGKLLIVLDQFEQWLHTQPIEETSDLIQALRECDGVQVQCVLMVRDDFWMPVTRFFQKLDIPLRENDNSAAVDLFDVAHARKVLRLFGIAYDRLPDGDLSQIDAQFLTDAVDGIAQSGWIMCVRLALFAEMMRGRPWSAESLAQIGGATGVGLAFLEETFSGPTAPPSHRMHQKAARNVLKALLPESGSNIRGRACREEELRQASGYQAHPNDFAELMHILDSEVRLITPTVADANGDSDEIAPTNLPASAQRHYQLTHDYLVAPLRDWLTRKQKETRRGRAQLLVEERAAAWKANPQQRHLPSWWESLRIALFTRRRTWNESERKMMRSAVWFHGVRTSFIVSMTVLALTLGVHTILDRMEAREQQEHRELEALIQEQRRKLVAELTGADWTGLPMVIDALRTDAEEVKPLLKQEFLNTDPGSPQRLPIALAILELSDDSAEQEREYVDYAFEELLRAEPEPFVLLRNALARSSTSLTDNLWKVLTGTDNNPTHQPLQAAAALATYNPRHPSWPQVAPIVTRQLLELDPMRVGRWHTELQPVAEQLAPPLTRLALDPKQLTARSILLGFVKNGTPAVRRAVIGELQAAADQPSAEREAAQANDTAPTLSADARSILEKADGRMTEDFAFCHGLTMDEFNGLRPELTTCRYRPVSVRPYSSGEVTKLAVAWTRDTREWEWKHGNAKEIRETNDDLIAKGYMPLDVSSWLTPGTNSEAQYAAVWVETDNSARTLHVGLPEATFPWQIGAPFDARTAPSLLCFSQVLEGGGRYTFSGIEVDEAASPSVVERLSGQEYAGDRYPGLLQVDLQVDRGAGSRSQADYWADQRMTLPKGADDDDADTLRWAKAVYYTSRFAVADNINDLDTAAGYLFVILHRRQLPKERLKEIAKWHVLLQATLGRRDGCETGLERLPDYENDKTERAFVRAMSICLLDSGNLDAIREGVRQQLEPAFPDARALYAAARVLAMAGEFARRRSDPQADACLAEAVGYLRQACTAEFAKPGELAEEPDFEPLRDRPDFKTFAAVQNIDKEYAAVWQASPQVESRETHGLTIADHLAWCVQRMNEGFDPVRIAVLDQDDRGKTAASVWHRPLVPLERQLLQARQQAAQAAVQFQLDSPAALRTGLASSTDPTLRSYLVKLLQEFGTEGKQLVILLSQETDPSVQSGLVLALGKYPQTDWDGETRRILDTTLERLYGTTDDHALRASIQWLLRRWDRKDQLAQWDEQLHGDNAQRKAAGSWYVTDVLHGPMMIPLKGGSFAMGSPGWEASRSDDELPHQVTIPRDFRMSATPVTRGQFVRFLRDDQGIKNQDRRERLLQRYESPDFRRLCPADDCPMAGVTWYLAAEYCNWLSVKEQFEPCYMAESNMGEFGPGMSPATNFVLRNGFRLPTEAEWEYACRAGTTTARYFGNDEELLPDYAWFAMNAGERTYPVGTRIPNGFGLFDMLGNVFTWCGDRYLPYAPADIDLGDNSAVDLDERVLRGGSFVHEASRARAAFRGVSQADQIPRSVIGFRIVQTIPADK